MTNKTSEDILRHTVPLHKLHKEIAEIVATQHRWFPESLQFIYAVCELVPVSQYVLAFLHILPFFINGHGQTNSPKIRLS